MVLVNFIFVILEDGVFWEFEIKGFFDGDIFVIFIVLGVFFREVVICFLLGDKVEMLVINRVGICVFIRRVED